MGIPQPLYSAMRFNFLYVDRYVFFQDWYYPESDIPYCMLRYMVKGMAMFVINGKEYMIKENEIAYIPEGCKLECYSLSNEVEFISIRFTITARLNDNDFLSEFFHIMPITHNVDPIAYEYFLEVYRSATSKNTGKLFRIRGNLELIIAYLVESDPAAINEKSAQPVADMSFEGIRHRTFSSSLKRDPRIQIVVDYLIAHPSEPFDVERLSQMAQMGPSTLRRLFKKHTGKSPGNFLTDLRMMTAARKLLTSNERVSTIAYETGYEDPNYFNRQFKKTFGLSPSRYRKQSRE